MVDNDHPSRDLLAAELRRSGYAVRTVDHGVQALQLLATGWLPRLIVTEVRLPIMDGPELVARLADDERWRSIPIVLASRDIGLPRACAMRPSAAIAKPVDPERFVELVRRALGELPVPRATLADGVRPVSDLPERITPGGWIPVTVAPARVAEVMTPVLAGPYLAVADGSRSRTRPRWAGRGRRNRRRR
jgi:CheY-like chemotaxis protein